MSRTIDSLAKAIGERINQSRIAAELTLDSLADQAQVSRRQLINIEKGDANPSISTLLKIAEALQVTLSHLIEIDIDSPFRITRASERSQLWTGSNGGSGKLVGFTNELCTVELWDWELNSNESHHSEPHIKGTKEILYVNQGTIRINLPKNEILLKRGDSLEFNADQAHKYFNPGKSTARYSLVVIEPKNRSNK